MNTCEQLVELNMPAQAKTSMRSAMQTARGQHDMSSLRVDSATSDGIDLRTVVIELHLESLFLRLFLSHVDDNLTACEIVG